MTDTILTVKFRSSTALLAALAPARPALHFISLLDDRLSKSDLLEVKLVFLSSPLGHF
jgi:hypothetical protein